MRRSMTDVVVVLSIVASGCVVSSAFSSSSITASGGRLSDFTGPIDPKGVTVSGLSGGASFALQFQVAFSSTVRGVASFAGIPPFCVWPTVNNIPKVLRCTTFAATIPSADRMYETALKLATLGLIDPVENLSKARLYVYHSKLDWNIKYPNARLVLDFYQRFVGESNALKLVDNIPSSHGFPTTDCCYPCYTFPLAPNFIVKCGYHGPFHALDHLYNGQIQPPAASMRKFDTGDTDGAVVTFDQSAFLPPSVRTVKQISLDQVGYLYIPRNCQRENHFSGKPACKLHVVFHGCLQGRQVVGDDVVLLSGFAQVADANDIVLLFPQAVVSLAKPFNPIGCWDWYGCAELDSSYATRNGSHMATVFNMIQSLLGPLPSDDG